MASVIVGVTFRLGGFTPTSAAEFVKNERKLTDVRNELARVAWGSAKWAFSDFKHLSAHIEYREGEMPRYTVDAYGINEYVVRDNGKDEYDNKTIIAGPFKVKAQADAVWHALQGIEDGTTYQSEPVEEDRGGDSGDTYDLPF